MQQEGWKDHNHDWRLEALLKVPTWAQEYMQFRVALMKCHNCQAYMTKMAGTNMGEDFYVTPHCQQQQHTNTENTP